MFYVAFIKRRIVMMLEQRKLALLTGLHANSNIGGEDLRRAVSDMEESFTDAKNSIYNKGTQDELDKDNPFFANMKVPEIDTKSAPVAGFAAMEPEPDVEVDQS